MPVVGRTVNARLFCQGARPSNLGVVFELDPAGNEKLLHTFAGGSTDGADPEAGLIMDASGNLYGTTFNGGTCAAFSIGCGTVFKITP